MSDFDDYDSRDFNAMYRANVRDMLDGPCEDDCEVTAPYIGMMPEETYKEHGSPLDFVEKATGQTDKEIDAQIGFMIRHSFMGDPSFFNR